MMKGNSQEFWDTNLCVLITGDMKQGPVFASRKVLELQDNAQWSTGV